MFLNSNFKISNYEMEYFLGIDLITFIKTIGYFGLFVVIFAESGLLIGFFLPGDSLLFTAGFLASQGFLNIWVLLAGTFLGAVLGDNFGYTFGRRLGPKIFSKDDSLFFHKDHIEKAKEFYAKYGGKALILARFLPVVRTFTPILAGVGQMRYKTFFFYNFTGGMIWTIGLTGLGFFLGNVVPNIDRYLIPIIFVIIFSSMLPTIFHILKNKELRDKIINFFKNYGR